MKKVFTFSTLGILVGASMSASAWWGPYEVPYSYAAPYAVPYAGPYWGGGGYSPQYPAYAPPPWIAPPAWNQGQFERPDANQWGSNEPPQWSDGNDMLPNDGTASPADIDKKLEMFEAERKQALDAIKARRAAFRAKIEAQRAAMKARRDAWQQQMEQHYAPTNAAPPVAPEISTIPAIPAQPEAASVEPSKAISAVQVKETVKEAVSPTVETKPKTSVDVKPIQAPAAKIEKVQ